MMKTAPLTPTASRATTAEKKPAHDGRRSWPTRAGDNAQGPGRAAGGGALRRVRVLTAGRAICGGCLAKGLTGRQASRSCDSKKVRARFSTLHQLAFRPLAATSRQGFSYESCRVRPASP